MLYCMAIMRLVNGTVETIRKKSMKRGKRNISIAEAAATINIPRMLVDIRHEGSHRDLPSLRLVRLASIKALDWLKSYYWEPQKNAISFQNDVTASVRKEIKSRLRELAFRLKTKQATRSSSILVKRKLVKHGERYSGCTKFLFHKAGKLQSSKIAGSRKKITKPLNALVRFYSTYPSEVISVLSEFLLKASDFSYLVELPENQVSNGAEHLHCVFDDWKSLITKLSNKEPELLLTLLKAVLEMIETREAIKYESGGTHLKPDYRAEIRAIEKLSNLFEWLVGNLKGLKPILSKEPAASEPESSPAALYLPKAALVELLRKCLLVSSPGNRQLMASAQVLAHMTRNGSLVQKLNKLSLLGGSNLDFPEENTSLVSSEDFLTLQMDSISQAARKLDFVKRHRVQGNVLKTPTQVDAGNKKRWAVAKSWNPCPIGMLSRDLSSSGRLPVLHCDDDDDDEEEEVLKSSDDKVVLKSSEGKRRWELNQCNRKREADCAVELLDYSSLKKMRGTEEGGGLDGEDEISSGGVKGKLMIGGVWKKIGEEELLAIASAIRILV
ncbi:uncharacterized protein LOC132299615 isoform X2 [Cornus florida]|nr:uncharacterized protein LOC132299615 isoform X2 [Cornus florida]